MAYNMDCEKKNVIGKDNRDMILDAMKGWAIIGVVVVHAWGERVSPYEVVNNFIGFMGSGVTMFLIITAYFSWKSLEKENPISMRDNIWWTIKHIVRLIPLYYVWLVISVWSSSADPFDLICHLAMLHGFIPKFINSINISWFVGTVAIFYMIVPWLYKKIDNLKNALIICGVCIPVCEIVSSAFFVMNLEDYDWRSFWSSFGIVSNFPVLLMGIILYFIMRMDGFKNLCGEKTAGRVLLGLCLYLIVVAIIVRHNILAITSYKYIAGVLFSGIICSQYIVKSRIIVNKLTCILGK